MNRLTVTGIATALAVGQFCTSQAAHAVDISPHRAIYSMVLDHAQTSSGIVGADGKMTFAWADACTGWTVEQRYELRLQYAEQDDSLMTVNFVTWESMDGLHYRFNVRKSREGEADEELKGTGDMPQAKHASTHGTDIGEAKFLKPDGTELPLRDGTLFPTGHTIALIEAALNGATILSKPVFDGGTVEKPYDVTASIGKPHSPDAKETNPLLKHRWWPMRLAFFPTDDDSSTPDYELGMSLQDNGVARDMTLDYGQFVVRAKLEHIEPLAKPGC